MGKLYGTQSTEKQTQMDNDQKELDLTVRLQNTTKARTCIPRERHYHVSMGASIIDLIPLAGNWQYWTKSEMHYPPPTCTSRCVFWGRSSHLCTYIQYNQRSRAPFLICQMQEFLSRRGLYLNPRGPLESRKEFIIRRNACYLLPKSD